MAEDYVVLDVRLTPRAALDRVEGMGTLSDGRSVLKARVRAVPEDGKANEALRRLLAETLGISRSAVSIVGGATSRVKRVRFDGDPAQLAAALKALAKKEGLP
jgi:uncharacterized protein YggU (UPF0235/DUF167 family)